MGKDLGMSFAEALGGGRSRVAGLEDDELLAGLGALARDKHRNDAAMLEHIAEVDARRLYAREGWTSMFLYCVEVLRLSEGATSKRVRAARLARRFPIVFDLIASGELHLGGISLLAAHLTDDNHLSVLERARGKTCRQIEKLVAELAPRPEVPASVRKLPSSQSSQSSQASFDVPPGGTEGRGSVGGGTEGPGAEGGGDKGPGIGGGSQSTWTMNFEPPSSNPERAGAGANQQRSGAAAEVVRGTLDVASGATVVPGSGGRSSAGGRRSRGKTVEVLSPERYLLKVTLGEEAKGKLEHAQDLLRHKVPDGDLATVIELALEAVIAKVKRRKFAKTSSPRKRRPRTERESAKGTTTGRRCTWLDLHDLPAEVKRGVAERDEERCSYRSAKGKRCGTRAWLEFHYVDPYAKGGPPTVENCALFCNNHNQYAADVDYGRAFMERMRRKGRGAREVGPVWEVGSRPRSGVAREAGPVWKVGARSLSPGACERGPVPVLGAAALRGRRTYQVPVVWPVPFSQEQQRSLASLQEALALSHLSSAQVSPGSSPAMRQMLSAFSQMAPARLQTSWHCSVTGSYSSGQMRMASASSRRRISMMARSSGSSDRPICRRHSRIWPDISVISATRSLRSGTRR
jgi:hypothetical protein